MGFQILGKNIWRSNKGQYFDCLPSPNICKQLLFLTCVGTDSKGFPKLAFEYFFNGK